jgi:putative ABC transport system permease protein
MLWNAITLALQSIKRNVLRSFLTILGIVIGVAAVIAMVTLGNGATQAIANQIASLGSNILMIGPKMEFRPGVASTAKPFELSDYEAIKAQINYLKAVAPLSEGSATVIFGSNNWSTTVVGTTNDYFIASNWTTASGRFFTEAEIQAGKSVCIIGETIRKELFNGKDPVGSKLRINNFSAEIIGVLKSKGQAGMGRDQDDTVIMPLRAVQRRITGSQKVNMMMLSVQDGVLSDDVIRQVTLLLRERRHISGKEEDDFDVMDTKEIAQTLSGTTKTLTGLLGAVAAVSLLVGGIGIMNIMLVSVTERTREIGTRLAVGALESEVMLQFMIEAVTLSSVGGVIGIIVATIASLILTRMMAVPYVFNLGINVLSFIFSASIGIIFGFMPARRAARLDPIVALRHE